MAEEEVTQRPSAADPRPELSIVMVTWNTREMTLACLRSLFASTRLRFEVILVDNGSHDGSAAAIARAFPEVIVLAETENHGFAAGNNLAATHARGDHLLLLNTDTIVEDRAIDALVAFARETPAARIWGGRTRFADGRLNPSSVWNRITPWSAVCFALGLVKIAPRSRWLNPEGIGGWPRDTVRQVDIVSGCFFLIDAALWRLLGGFDPAFFMYGEEADLCARARAIGVRPMMTPAATIVHHGGASTANFANRIIYVFGARIGLMQRHLGRARRFGCWTLLFAAWWRATVYRALAGFCVRFAASASEWGEAWRRRSEWRHGPPQRGIDRRARERDYEVTS